VRVDDSLTLKWMFGWQTLVTNRTTGGVKGYSRGTLMLNLKRAPSKGVSCGPRMKAVHA
jgi:hypothetical protein